MTPLVESATKLAVEHAFATGKRIGFARGLGAGIVLCALLVAPSLVVFAVFR